MMDAPDALRVNGWALYFHPLLVDQIDRLVTGVQKDIASGKPTSANVKLFDLLVRHIFETVPIDPTRAEFWQGGTLGPGRKHWFRIKFANGRFRLFFRYALDQKVIVFAWVNDATTLRTYGAKTDAYAVFKRMLEAGNPPDDLAALIVACGSVPDSLTRP